MSGGAQIEQRCVYIGGFGVACCCPVHNQCTGTRVQVDMPEPCAACQTTRYNNLDVEPIPTSGDLWYCAKCYCRIFDE